MNKKLTFRILITVCLVLGLMLTVCACDNSGNKETESNTEATPTEAPTKAPTQAPTQALTQAPTEEPTQPETELTGYKITVVDEQGNALEGVFAQICSGDLCLAPYFTDSNGTVVVEQDLSEYTVKAYLDGYTAEKAEYAFEDGSKTMTIVMTKN